MDLFSWPTPIGGTPQRDDWVLLTAFAPVLTGGFALSPGSIPPNVLGSELGLSEGATRRHDRFGVNYGRGGQVIRTEHTNSGRTTSFRGPDRDSNLSPNYLFGLSAEGARLGEADDVRSAQRSRWLSCLMLLGGGDSSTRQR